MNIKKSVLLSLVMSLLFFGANAYSAEKPISLSVDCQPLSQRPGAPAVAISGLVKLKKQPNGAFMGAGKLSIRISTTRGETILEQEKVAVNAYFDDILVPTLQAVPKDEESVIANLALFQKKDDTEEEDQSLLSTVELKDGTTYYTQCNLTK
ncbi:MAG: hypothetical protein A2Z91_01300 [Deltaproteobacteria bacterium GWA2_38_16]|nr:MAG: hypothetical protein A2Z91_01300 [Deltaproteobacteria bacterium GWA2_38_16]OGQ02183.1 MAG: hypothetical protein A3D19_05375 [Deltaproteobacteria bacterium RIFCSPHIGHO2_02_FULL_38_15]OGQ34471.1 MAG: hypothetical protein A3A72_04870 [Deltaproteobacteria bacterium RIFCSPLOWO2_01_FULL_38_9]OGQ61585.1 MAG: hypothetical protein A3G92_04740 [Deltaproteobacteria bacterium RIFCSPLOWO2_12_FULL_38_8]HBQ21977.1 hypothetical protein [Deltaproteobacteria bacterium]